MPECSSHSHCDQAKRVSAGLYLSWGDMEHVLLAVLACLDVSELVVDLFVGESNHTCKTKNSDVSSLDSEHHHTSSRRNRSYLS